MIEARFAPLTTYRRYPEQDMAQRASEFYADISRRRTAREFSERNVPRTIIEDCLRAAGTAPSGANMQPWHFVVVEDPAIKKLIRAAAEKEEHEFYTHRASPEWLEALKPLGTDEHKPFLERAPYLIAIFMQKWGMLPDGRKVKHYYPTESVGLASGLLLAALHHMGLASLTHTPSPMGFLNEILARPKHEKPYLLIVTGYPAENAQVPEIGRKELKEFSSFF